MSNAAALELLKAQAALLPLDDSSTLVTSAVAHGQTLHLTEAGRQALKLIKPVEYSLAFFIYVMLFICVTSLKWPNCLP